MSFVRWLISPSGPLFRPRPATLLALGSIGPKTGVVGQQPGHEGKINTLTGPESLTHSQFADQLSMAPGRAITVVSIPSAAMRESLNAADFPAWQADGLIEDYAHYSRNEETALSKH